MNCAYYIGDRSWSCEFNRGRYPVKKHLVKKQLVIGALMLGSASANALLIDSFEAPGGAPLQTAIANEVTTSDTDLDYNCGASCIGGYRDSGAEFISNDFAASGVKVEAGGGFLSYSAESGVNGQGFVRWDGFAGAGLDDGIGLSGYDFLANGTAFAFSVTGVDLGFTAELTVTDAIGGSYTLEIVSTAEIPPDPGPISVVRSFDIWSGNGVDMTRVSSITLDLATSNSVNVDLTIDNFDTVPIPGTLALLGLGLFAVGGVSRRRAA